MLILETLWNKTNGALEAGPKGETNLFYVLCFSPYKVLPEKSPETTP